MKDTYEILKKIEECKGTKEKVEFLSLYKNDETLKKVLTYCYEPTFNYGISKKSFGQILRGGKPTENVDLDLFELLDILAENNINKKLKQLVINYVASNDIYCEKILSRILNGNMEIGISIINIEKVFPGFITKYNVQLAEKFEERYVKDKIMFITEKLDGVRCIYNNGVFKSRSGRIIKGLDHIREDIERLSLVNEDTVLDGELIFNNEDGSSREHNFRKTSMLVNSNAKAKVDIHYRVFDSLTAEEFKKGESENTYSQRREFLNSLNDEINSNKSKYIKVVPLVEITYDTKTLYDLFSKYQKLGAEGLMVNLDEKYKCKRHSGILKVKATISADLMITGVKEGENENEGKLGSIIVNYKGNSVSVGTGFTKQQRIEFWENPNSIIGKIAEIHFFEESNNKKGTCSMRIPIFERIREDKDTESYS